MLRYKSYFEALTYIELPTVPNIWIRSGQYWQHWVRPDTRWQRYARRHRHGCSSQWRKNNFQEFHLPKRFLSNDKIIFQVFWLLHSFYHFKHFPLFWSVKNKCVQNIDWSSTKSKPDFFNHLNCQFNQLQKGLK